MATEASEAVEGVIATPGPSLDPKDHSVESLMGLVTAERLNQLDKKSLTGYRKLKKLHDEISTLHQLLKGINRHKEPDGSLDWSSNAEMQEHLKKGQRLGIEVDLDKSDAYKFSASDLEGLTENVRLTKEDMTAEKEMLIQEVTRLTSERLESYQFARSIYKPQHEDKINKARAIAGR